MSRNKYPWKWKDGVCSIHGMLTPFVLKILENPADSLTHLVLADYLEDTFGEPVRCQSEYLRKSGYWRIASYTNTIRIGLSWQLDDWRDEKPTYTIAHIGRKRIPNCTRCGILPHLVQFGMGSGYMSMAAHKGVWVCARYSESMCDYLVRHNETPEFAAPTT